MKHVLGEAAEHVSSSFLERLLNALGSQILRQWLGRVANPEVMLVFGIAIFLAAFLIGVCVVVNLMIGRRRARVFISFQHERESIAHALASELARSGIAPVRLPFVEN